MKNGGLYKNVKMSVRTADLLVLITVAVFAVCLIFAVSHGGFTVTFDTNGGTDVQACKVMYGDKIQPSVPEKENCSFTGWYLDEECKEEWDTEKDTAAESMTLYAGWKKQ